MILTEQYAAFMTRLGWSGLPDDVRDYALDLIADWTANAAAGFDSPIGQIFWRLSKYGSGQDHSVVLGNLQTVDPLSAALINGAASHAVEFDDTHRGGLYHPGSPVIAAAWAAGGIQDISGQQFICAVVAGYEISMRLAAAINPEHYKIWHTTGTVGAIGAAASAGYCLALSSGQITGALGLAGTQAAGLWEYCLMHPRPRGFTPARPLIRAYCRHCWQERGCRVQLQSLRVSVVFAGFVPAAVDVGACCAGLGTDWWLPKTTIKAYPVCGHTMTPIEAALAIAKDVDPDQIERIDIRAHPVSVNIAANPAPQTEAEAKFSIEFCVASALVLGEVTQRAFSHEQISSPAIQRLLRRTTLIADNGSARLTDQRPAQVSVRLLGGRTVDGSADFRKGDPENPMNAIEKHKKIIDLTEAVWGSDLAEKIYEMIMVLPQEKSFKAWLTEFKKIAND